MEQHLEAAGISKADLWEDAEHVGFTRAVRVADHPDRLAAAFALLESERRRHGEALAKIEAANERKRAADTREKRERELDDSFRKKFQPPE